jgi:hypothetical protein
MTAYVPVRARYTPARTRRLPFAAYGAVCCLIWACESTPEVRRECLSEGGCAEGRGAMIWFVQRYEGEFHEGLMHGQGVMRYGDGRVYSGKWRYGREEGQGEMTWPDGKRYSGQWRGGEPHGQGVLTLPDGYRMEGRFENGYFVRR